MSITEQGIQAEKKAREFLNKRGLYNLQQCDWLVKNEIGKYFFVEVKQRELYKPPPFIGTGLDILQLKRRIQIFNDLKIDTMLLVFESNTKNIYFQFISELEKTKYYDTKKNIRIYDIKYFIGDVL